MKTLSLLIVMFLTIYSVNGSGLCGPCGSCPNCCGACILDICLGICLPFGTSEAAMEEWIAKFPANGGNCTAIESGGICQFTSDDCIKGFSPLAIPPSCNCSCVIPTTPPPTNTCEAKYIGGKRCKITYNDCSKGYYPYAKPKRCYCKCRPPY